MKRWRVFFRWLIKPMSPKWQKRMEFVRIGVNVIIFCAITAGAYFLGTESYNGFPNSGITLSNQGYWVTGLVTGILSSCSYWILYIWIKVVL